jgi:TRAP-type C4-dicarboxylate transport system substrate-binding protein
MKRLFLKSLISALSLSVGGLAMAQDKTIKFANQNSAGHPIAQGMEKFKEIVEAKSGGKLKVNLFLGGALGSDQANVSALQGGTLEMVSMNSGILASQVKDFGVFDFPFMFADGKEADAVVDGPFGKKMHAKLPEKGIVGLGFYELGFRHMSNGRRPITKVADIEGLKLRVIPTPSTSTGSRRWVPTPRRYRSPSCTRRWSKKPWMGRKTRWPPSTRPSSTKCRNS